MVDNQETHMVGKVLPEALCLPEGFLCSLLLVFFGVFYLAKLSMRRRLLAVHAAKGTSRKAERPKIDRGISVAVDFICRLLTNSVSLMRWCWCD